MDVGLMREYWFLNDEQMRRSLVGTIFSAVCIWGAVSIIILGTLLAITRNQLGVVMISQLPFSWLMLVLTIGAVESVFALLLTIFRIREQAIQFVVLSLGRMLLFLTTAIAAVWMGRGVGGALAARLLSGILGVLATGLLARRYISLNIDWAGFKRVLHYGLPLLPASIASYILFASDRYVLEHFSTLETVAIYSFAYKIATTLDVIVTRPFAMDWAPRRFKIATAADAPRKYAQALVLYSFIAVAFALGIIAVTPALYILLIPPVYQAGARIVPIIMAAYVVYGLSYPLNVGIMLKDRTRYLPIISWIAAFACLGLNLWLIPRYGMTGAAWATLLAYLVWTTGITWMSLRLYPVPYSPRQIVWVVIAAAAGYGGIWVVEATELSRSWVFALLFKVAWIAMVLALSGYGIWRAYRSGRRPDANIPLKPEVTSSQ